VAEGKENATYALGDIKEGKHRACMAMGPPVCVVEGNHEREPGEVGSGRGEETEMHIVRSHGTKTPAAYSERWSDSTECDMRGAER
jgi:hypothetical protein